MALDSDLRDFAYNLSIQISQSFSFLQDDNNQAHPQTTWPLFKYSYTIIITKKILESANYKMCNKY